MSTGNSQNIFHRRLPQLSAALISLTLLLVAGALVLWTLALWYKYHPHMPWRDTLPLLRDLLTIFEGNYTGTDLLALLEPHYTAHRVLVPRLLLLLDLRLFAGQSHLFFAVGWASMALLLLLQGSAARSYFRGCRTGLLASLTLFTIFLFAPTHLWNLLNPLNSSWHLSIALSMLALFVAGAQHTPLSARRVTVAYTLLTLAALTNFSGVIAWLLLPVLFLLDRRRYSVWAFVGSGLFVLIYIQGVASDAEIALNITADLPPSDAVQDMEQEAQAVLANNNLWLVIARTVDLLAWPLSRGSQHWPRIPVVLSLLGLASLWVYTIRNWWLHRSRLHPWLVFCLLGASLCLGIAASVQFGRLLTYPDAIHGPSPARYQTFIVGYWAYISGLAVSLGGRRAGWRQTSVLALTCAVALLLVLAPGATLARQLKSAEYAAMLYLVGEQQELKSAPQSMAASFTSDYALAFDALFSSHGLAYHAAVSIPERRQDLPLCSNLGVQLEKSDPLAPLSLVMAPNADFQTLIARVQGSAGMGIRHILIFNGPRLAGRLGPQHRGDFSPRQLAQAGHYEWLGGYMKSAASEPWSTVSLEALLSPPRSCKVRLSE
ncbi:MAG: hypothetical protein O7F73_06885 [Gammaproteobacteria bacterium]|nr:hypothetical protein [Gammaproteobacteria bacterium]